MKRVLVISPHQDDDVIGCGGLLLKMCDFHKTVVYFYKEESTKEVEKSGEILGVEEKISLEIDSRQASLPADCIVRLAEVFKKIKPEIIIFVNKDGDRDHDLCHDVAKEAVFLSEVKGDYSPEYILGYSVWSEIFKPELFVDISDVINTKIDAIRSHKSQNEVFNYVDLVTSRAKVYGLISGYDFAECYRVYKTSEKGLLG